MELRPADLGGELAVQVVKARVAIANAGRRVGRFRTAFAEQTAKTKPTSLNMIDKLMLRGSGFSAESGPQALVAMGTYRRGVAVGAVAASLGILPGLMTMASQGNMAGAGAMGAVGITMSALMGTLFLTSGRRYLSSPVTDDELVNLTVTNQGSTLRQNFLRLARDVRKQESISPEAEAGLRDALRAVGEAMEKLPFSPVNTIDASELRRNAAAIRAQADAETDAVTQASLSRQADAVERSAAAAERSSLLTKRTTALQAELAAQIESLRLGLTAFYTGDTDVSGLAALSENVRAVAAEATSVADARTELDAAVNTYSSPATPQAQTITIGR